jgi:hypothetical protein
MNLIEQLQPYMINIDPRNISYSNKHCNYKNKQNKKSEQSEQSEKENIILKSCDVLFWCFYIAKNGYTDYMMNNKTHHMKSFEKAQKIILVNSLRNNNNLIKCSKNSLINLEHSLVNDELMSMNTLNSLCLVNDISFLLIKNNISYNVGVLKKNEYDAILYTDNLSSLRYNVKLLDVNKLLETTLWLFESVIKPLRPYARYKLPELQEIAVGLNIDIVIGKKKVLKQDLYTKIKEIIEI